MTPPLIHIGYFKSGSTWLQHELFSGVNESFEPLSRDRIGKASWVKALWEGAQGMLSAFDLDVTGVSAERDTILRDRGRFHGKVPVISNERLSGNPNGGGCDSAVLAQRLHRAFPDARILIVFREQRGFILSMYFQYLSMGGTKSLRAYLCHTDSKIPSFSPHHIAYLPLVEAYRSLFGPNNVLALPYEMFARTPADFVTRISNLVCRRIDVHPSRFDLRHNTKSHHFVSYYLRHLNHFLHCNSLNGYSAWPNGLTTPLARLIVRSACAVVPTNVDQTLTHRLKQEIEGWCGSRFDATNSQLGALLDLHLADWGYRTAARPQ